MSKFQDLCASGSSSHSESCLCALAPGKGADLDVKFVPGGSEGAGAVGIRTYAPFGASRRSQ